MGYQGRSTGRGVSKCPSPLDACRAQSGDEVETKQQAHSSIRAASIRAAL